MTTVRINATAHGPDNAEVSRVVEQAIGGVRAVLDDGRHTAALRCQAREQGEVPLADLHVDEIGLYPGDHAIDPREQPCRASRPVRIGEAVHEMDLSSWRVDFDSRPLEGQHVRLDAEPLHDLRQLTGLKRRPTDVGGVRARDQ